MADSLTIVGAVTGSTLLASQIISNIKKIISIYQQVQKAPNKISFLLEDINSTSRLPKRLSEDTDEDEITLKSLGAAKRIVDELRELLEGLNMR